MKFHLNCNCTKKSPIGIWGQRHKRYLKEHKKSIYTTLLPSGKLNSYLADIDKQEEEMFSQLVKQLAEKWATSKIEQKKLSMRN